MNIEKLKKAILYVIKWLSYKENIANIVGFLTVLYALIETSNAIHNMILKIIYVLIGVFTYFLNIKVPIEKGGEDAEL